jgi:alpha-tubulin suppressor-like RCC1 family protein
MTENGALYTWGYNENGNLGIGDCTSGHGTPTLAIRPGSGITQIAAGNGHTIVLYSDGTVGGWGNNSYSAVGIEGERHTSVGKKLPVLGDPNSGIKIVAIGTGINSSYAISQRGELYVWGFNSSGQLGIGDAGGSMQPTPVLNKHIRVALPRKFWGWPIVFRWIFLGRSDENSIFSVLPIEVIFHFAFVEAFLYST